MSTTGLGSLSGYSIGITADRRAGEQISFLTGRGAECLHGPTVRTHPILPEAEIREATLAVLERKPEFVVATTGIGVRGWMEAADALLIGEELRAVLGQARLLVRGPKAHGAAVAAGLTVEWDAPTATTAEVIDHLAQIIEPHQTVAVQVDGGANPPLIEDIRARGIDVLPVPVYRWTLPDDLGPAQTLVRSVADGKVDALTFTSRPAAENFSEVAEGMGLLDEVRTATASQVVLCSIGSICSEGLRPLDIGQVVQPDRFRLGAMVMTLTRVLQARAKETQIGGHRVAIQGRQATVADEAPVMLTLRERQVLDSLIERPGTVRSKTDLLDEVWGSRESGPHVVEVTVGRLRRRLGDAGTGIETVMKRGYRASPE